MIETYGASSVFIPDSGWFLFGGNSLNTSQKLVNINSQWEKGPAVQGTGIKWQCAVQVRSVLPFASIIIIFMISASLTFN